MMSETKRDFSSVVFEFIDLRTSKATNLIEMEIPYNRSEEKFNNIYIYIYIYIYDGHTDFFRMGTFIDSTHMKL